MSRPDKCPFCGKRGLVFWKLQPNHKPYTVYECANEHQWPRNPKPQRNIAKELRAENAALKDMLRKHEFANDSYMCPECDGKPWETPAHKPDCAWAALIKEEKP